MYHLNIQYMPQTATSKNTYCLTVTRCSDSANIYLYYILQTLATNMSSQPTQFLSLAARCSPGQYRGLHLQLINISQTLIITMTDFCSPPSAKNICSYSKTYKEVSIHFMYWCIFNTKCRNASFETVTLIMTRCWSVVCLGRFTCFEAVLHIRIFYTYWFPLLFL